MALWREIDFTWPLVFTGGWVLLSTLLPTVLGAFLGGAATGRRKAAAGAQALG